MAGQRAVFVVLFTYKRVVQLAKVLLIRLEHAKREFLFVTAAADRILQRFVYVQNGHAEWTSEVGGR